MSDSGRQGAFTLPYDLLSSREIENIFENSDFIYMLNQAAGDRQILAKALYDVVCFYISFIIFGIGIREYPAHINKVIPFLVVVPFLGDFLKSEEIEGILGNSDFVYLLNQNAKDQAILADKLGLSTAHSPGVYALWHPAAYY